ncbi:hypothetical protein GGI15_002640, partial [Coemansia interrupta]
TDTPSVLNFEVPLPANLPGTDHAVFAWTWVNASGNREFYMNCADIAISGPAGSFTGKQMTILNYPGYPVVPEFLGNYNTGLAYYTNATQLRECVLDYQEFKFVISSSVNFDFITYIRLMQF